MSGWFTIEKIDAQTFAISEYKHWEETHCYLLCGREMALLIDTDLGGRQIQVVHTPGHSPGHCCFYEQERGYLFSGDLVYVGCLYAFYPTTDPQLFYDSVKRVRKLNVTKILPGHHQLNIPVSLIDEIEAGFAQIEKGGKLKQGIGLFDFGEVQIQI